MTESVAVAKEADVKKGVSATKSDNSIPRLRNEPERQLGSLRSVIEYISRDGGTPSSESIATQLSSMHTAQRATTLLALQQTHGNRYVQRVVSGIQAKLVVGQPGDKYEQEADRVADAVMRMPEPEVQRQVEPEEEELLQTKTLTEKTTPLVQRPVEEEEEEILQTKRGEDVTSEVTQDLESQIQSIQGGGQPLTESDRAFFEPRFGHDFNQVRVHTGAQAAKSARAVNAKAYTMGQDVVFGAGQYAPGTAKGRKLLAHELTHVVQQNGARQDPEKKLNLLHIHRESSPSVMRDILLKIVKYQGSSITDPNIDVQIADHIYDQCNHLNVASAPVNNVGAPNPLSDLGGDTTLDFDSSAEVDAVKRRATATGPGEVPVAYVGDILRDNRRGFSGYTLDGLVAVSNRSRQPHILAHEVGHYLGLEHAGHGSRDLMYEDPETITYAQSRPPMLLQSDCRTVQSRVQPKLTVSTPGDMYEQEADRVADQVMRMPEPHLQNERVYTCAGEFPERRKEQGKQKYFQIEGVRSNRDRETVASPIVQEVIRSPGQPLSATTRAFFEPRFDHDFSNVRVHIDARAAESTRAVNALAYTVGRHIAFGSGQYASGTHAGRRLVSTKGVRLLSPELTHTIQQNSGSRNGVLIQRTLEEDINSLLERRMPSPNTAENRISIIAALCRMQIQAEEIERLAERRRILREVFDLAEPTGESARLLERLDDPEDSLHDPFNRLATATRNEMLNILRLSSIRHVAENAPQWSFRDPEVGRGTELNPEFWLVRYSARRGRIWMNANNQGENSSALVALRNHPLWNGYYDEIRLRLEIVDEANASEAVEDAYNPASRSHYSIECNIGANLVQLRRMHLYYLEQGSQQHRSQSDANQAFDRDYNNFRVSLEVERNPAAPGEPISREESSLLDTALERLDWERIPIRSGPNFNGLVRPGDWAAIDSTDLVSGLFMYENVIYLGNNEFWGQGIPSPFTAQYYAENYIINTPTSLRRRTPWPSSVAEILRYMFVVPTGRPRSPEITF